MYSSLKAWLVWLAMVAFFFMLIWPQFPNYMARVQMSEALSLVTNAKSDILDFYEIHHRCPRNNAEIKEFPKQGTYVADVSFAHIKGSDACYIVAEMADTPQVDRRIRGSKLVLVTELPSPWSTQVNCLTDIKQPVADCQLSQGGGYGQID